MCDLITTGIGLGVTVAVHAKDRGSWLGITLLLQTVTTLVVEHLILQSKMSRTCHLWAVGIVAVAAHQTKTPTTDPTFVQE